MNTYIQKIKINLETHCAFFRVEWKRKSKDLNLPGAPTPPPDLIAASLVNDCDY